MKVTIVGLAAIAFMAQSALVNWTIDAYESGCNDDDGNGGLVLAGHPGQELWCISTTSSHNIRATGIKEDNMEMWLFSSWDCIEEGALIAHITENGCHVIPSDTVVEAIRVLPKK